jgi:hypothetical protein
MEMSASIDTCVPSIGRIAGLNCRWLWFDRSQVKAYALMMAGRTV